jgi:hypothetical protein
MSELVTAMCPGTSAPESPMITSDPVSPSKESPVHDQDIVSSSTVACRYRRRCIDTFTSETTRSQRQPAVVARTKVDPLSRHRVVTATAEQVVDAVISPSNVVSISARTIVVLKFERGTATKIFADYGISDQGSSPLPPKS